MALSSGSSDQSHKLNFSWFEEQTQKTLGINVSIRHDNPQKQPYLALRIPISIKVEQTVGGVTEETKAIWMYILSGQIDCLNVETGNTSEPPLNPTLLQFRLSRAPHLIVPVGFVDTAPSSRDLWAVVTSFARTTSFQVKSDFSSTAQSFLSDIIKVAASNGDSFPSVKRLYGGKGGKDYQLPPAYEEVASDSHSTLGTKRRRGNSDAGLSAEPRKRSGYDIERIRASSFEIEAPKYPEAGISALVQTEGVVSDKRAQKSREIYNHGAISLEDRMELRFQEMQKQCLQLLEVGLKVQQNSVQSLVQSALDTGLKKAKSDMLKSLKDDILQTLKDDGQPLSPLTDLKTEIMQVMDRKLVEVDGKIQQVTSQVDKLAEDFEEVAEKHRRKMCRTRHLLRQHEEQCGRDMQDILQRHWKQCDHDIQDLIQQHEEQCERDMSVLRNEMEASIWAEFDDQEDRLKDRLEDRLEDSLAMSVWDRFVCRITGEE